jgi:hypothetical protein
MTTYSTVLFIHVTAVLLLFATMSFEVLSLFHLRRATTVIDIRRWMEMIPGLPLVAMGSILLVLFFGVYLAMRMSAFGLAWPRVTIGTFLLMAPLGAVSGRRMRAIRMACADSSANHSELLSQLQSRFLKISLGIRIAVFLGIVLLMAAKPELWESVGIVGTAVALGFLSSFLTGHRSGPLSAQDAGLRA